ncbi:hypothetical protein J6590_027923 [Homalodisca vitripennis]|nr:hypothetical protein J6590_027923 [Homalodisca vitripennis]
MCADDSVTQALVGSVFLGSLDLGEYEGGCVKKSLWIPWGPVTGGDGAGRDRVRRSARVGRQGSVAAPGDLNKCATSPNPLSYGRLSRSWPQLLSNSCLWRYATRQATLARKTYTFLTFEIGILPPECQVFGTTC